MLVIFKERLNAGVQKMAYQCWQHSYPVNEFNELVFFGPAVRYIPHRQFEHVLDTRPTTKKHTELKRRKFKGAGRPSPSSREVGRRSVYKSATRASDE